MPDNIIYQPHLNAIKFYEVAPADIPQYLSRHMDDWLFANQIRDFEQPVKFFLKWLNQDGVRLQFTSNFQPLTLKLLNCEGHEIYSQVLNNKQQDIHNPSFYIRESELDFGSLGLEDGLYYFTIPEASWISEPKEIVSGAPNTLYIEYTDSSGYYEGVVFGTPITMRIRVPAILKYKSPGSVDTVYADQNQAETMLHSIPYRVYQFILGGQGGVPPWLIDKVARIFGCDTLKIDGREFTKAEGATWEVNELEDYPMAGWSIDLREKLNRSSLIYENDNEIIGRNAMMQVIDTKGFGIEDNGGDFLEVVDVE